MWKILGSFFFFLTNYVLLEKMYMTFMIKCSQNVSYKKEQYSYKQYQINVCSLFYIDFLSETFTNSNLVLKKHSILNIYCLLVLQICETFTSNAPKNVAFLWTSQRVYFQQISLWQFQHSQQAWVQINFLVLCQIHLIRKKKKIFQSISLTMSQPSKCTKR